MVTPRLVRSPAGATLAVTLAVTSPLRKTTPWRETWSHQGVRRADTIWTCDPLTPSQVRYQAAPQPVAWIFSCSGRPERGKPLDPQSGALPSCATARDRARPSVTGGPRDTVPRPWARGRIGAGVTCGTRAAPALRGSRAVWGARPSAPRGARRPAGRAAPHPPRSYTAVMPGPEHETPHGETPYSPTSLLRALTANPYSVAPLRPHQHPAAEAAPPDNRYTRAITLLLALVLGFAVAVSVLDLRREAAAEDSPRTLLEAEVRETRTE